MQKLLANGNGNTRDTTTDKDDPSNHAIKPGNTVRIQLLGQTTWSRGVCKAMVGPRSYELAVGGAAYRCNRSHLIPKKEPVKSDSTSPPPLYTTEEEESVSDTHHNRKVHIQSHQSHQFFADQIGRPRKPSKWLEDYGTAQSVRELPLSNHLLLIECQGILDSTL